MLGFIQSGIGLGFSAGVLPGPLQSYIINTTLAYGWRKSIYVIFSPLIVDSPIILTVLLVLREFPDNVIRGLQIAGGLFVLFIARGAWRQYQAGVQIGGDGNVTVPDTGHIFRRALLMNVLSPGPYVFWGTVTGPLLIDALDISALHGVVFVVIFYGVFLSMLAVNVFIFDHTRRLDPQIVRRVLLLTIIILLWFGFDLITRGALDYNPFIRVFSDLL